VPTVLIPLLATVTVLIATNAAGARRTGWSYVAINLAGTAVLALIAWFAGLSADQLGLGAAELGPGLLWGLGGAALIVGSFSIGAWFPGTRKAFRDERVAKERPAETWRRALVVLPLGTVALEDVAFRGLLMALVAVDYSTVTAIVVSSLLFGLWHLRSAGEAHQANPHAVDALRGTQGRIAAIAIVILATGTAGVGLGALREVSGSLLAPAIVHFAVNATGLVLAMVVLRNDLRQTGA